MKKNYINYLGVFCLTIFTACANGDTQNSTKENKQESASLQNNDLTNAGVKGPVKKSTTVFSYKITGADNSIIDQSTDSIIAMYDNSGNLAEIRSYKTDGTLSYHSERTHTAPDAWEEKTIGAGETLITTSSASRNEQTIEMNETREATGAYNKKTQYLNDKFLIEKAETISYQKTGEHIFTQTETYSYDDQNNKIKSTTETISAKGASSTFTFDMFIQETDEHQNPTKFTSVSKNPTGNMESTVQATYEYYE